MKVNDLKARIARADYDVDVDAVAEAFVARVLAVHATLRHKDVQRLLDEGWLDLGDGSGQSSCS